MGSKGAYRPFRRKVCFADAHPVMLEAVTSDLDLTSSPNWGYNLCRGLVPLSLEDFELLRTVMT